MYEAKQAQLDHDIEMANVELEKSRIILQAARQEKKRKLQYEVTLVVAQRIPTVQLTEQKTEPQMRTCCYRRKGRNVYNTQSGPKLKQRLLQFTKKSRHCRQRQSKRCRSMR